MQAHGAVMGGTEFQIPCPFRNPGRVFKDPAKARHKGLAVHFRRPIKGDRRMHRGPVAGDVDAARRPNAVEAADIVDEALQPGHLAGATDQAAMQADAHHLRLPRLPFGIKHIEGVLQILIELLAGDVAGRGGEAHVIRLQRIGDDQLVTPTHALPIGQIVVISVGHIGELPGFGGQRHGIDAATPGIPALGRGAHDLCMQADRLGDGGGFFGLGHVLVLDPFQPVRRDFPARILHRRHLFGAARQGRGHAVNRHRNIHPGEQPVQPPEPGARPVFIDGFHVPVPLPRPLRRPGNIGQEGFRCGIAVQHVVFAAFFVIQHELYGDLRAVRPFRIRRVGPIAAHVTRITIHEYSPSLGQL